MEEAPIHYLITGFCAVWTFCITLVWYHAVRSVTSCLDIGRLLIGSNTYLVTSLWTIRRYGSVKCVLCWITAVNQSDMIYYTSSAQTMMYTPNDAVISQAYRHWLSVHSAAVRTGSVAAVLRYLNDRITDKWCKIRMTRFNVIISIPTVTQSSLRQRRMVLIGFNTIPSWKIDRNRREAWLLRQVGNETSETRLNMWII